jgi:ATP-dependent protease ClpP protease subunit
MDAILKIYGDIGEPDQMSEMFGITDNTTSAKAVSDFLDENKNATSITVKINSRGGDVQEGWSIYDLLTTSGKKIKTIGEGKVYSIATIIFLAGSEREMMKNADGLIHNPYIPPYTLADAYESGDLLKIAEGLQQEESKILDFYAEKTGTDKAKLAEYMSADTKLSAEDMLSLGFATKVIEPVKAYAFIKPKNTFKMDEKEKAAFFEKLGATLDSAVAKMFSRLPAVDQKMTDKDGKEFKLEKETGAPAVGDKASPDGTYTMVSGEKITVAGGVVSEITESDTELAKANAKIAELEAYKTAAEAEKATIAAAKVEDDKKVAAAVALVTELTALKNTWKPEGRSQNFSKGKETGTFDLERAKKIAKDLDKSETIKTE